MKELLRRTFFGLIYVLVVVYALQSFEGKSLLLLLFMIIALKEFSTLLPLHFNTVLLPSFLVFLVSFLQKYKETIDPKVYDILITFLIIVLFVPLIYFIFDKISREQIANVYLAFFYISVPFVFALGLQNKMLLTVFIIIWASDSFAYLTGKYLGKHKLAEKISPKKTIEGVVGGMLGSLLVAFIIYKKTDWAGNFNLNQFLILALIIVFFGTLGDLLESRFKRLAGVKDAGNLIPGHGGILDRLDSFILAVPFVTAYYTLII